MNHIDEYIAIFMLNPAFSVFTMIIASAVGAYLIKVCDYSVPASIGVLIFGSVIVITAFYIPPDSLFSSDSGGKGRNLTGGDMMLFGIGLVASNTLLLIYSTREY